MEKQEWTINDARQLPQTSIWRYGASGGAGGREINTDRITRNIARIVKLGIRHGSSLYAITVHFRRLDGVEDFYHLGGGGEHHPLTEVQLLYIYAIKADLQQMNLFKILIKGNLDKLDIQEPAKQLMGCGIKK